MKKTPAEMTVIQASRPEASSSIGLTMTWQARPLESMRIIRA
ncbi:hypothetical protein [Paenibacillus sp. D9]|nr:hypothetical protein [Paenibacillus sp. D9]